MRHVNLPLYPDCFLQFCEESGRVRTKATKEAFMVQMRALHHRHPGKKVRDFTAQDLTAFCMANGAAPATQKTRRALLQSFFGWATFTGLVNEDPSRDLKFLVQPGNHKVRRHVWLQPDEFRRLLTEMPTETMVDRRDRMIVYVAALIGLRRTNLAELRWNQFTPGFHSVRVKTKGQKLMEFGVPDLLQHELELWRKELAGIGQSEDGPVFPAFHHELHQDEGYVTACIVEKPLQHFGLAECVNKITEETIGVRMCPHDCRRSYAAFLESEGFSVQDIQKALGHENLATTSVYLDKNPNRAVSVGRSLNVRL
jgi:integrase